MISNDLYFKLHGILYGMYYDCLSRKYFVKIFDDMQKARDFMELASTDRERHIRGRCLVQRVFAARQMGEDAVAEIDEEYRQKKCLAYDNAIVLK